MSFLFRTRASLSLLHGVCIIALPLTSGTPSNQRRLTYYHFQTSVPADSTEHIGWVHQARSKANDAWAAMGRAEDEFDEASSQWPKLGRWLSIMQKKIFDYGEVVMDSVEFEEVALQSVDAPLGLLDSIGAKELTMQDVIIRKEPIPVIYPPSLNANATVLEDLKNQIAEQLPEHRKGYVTWLIIAPIVSPFGIIPVLPNIPLYYALWRSWSHYKAYKASEYLNNLFEQNLITPQPEPAIDKIYYEFKNASDGLVSEKLGESEHTGRLLIGADSFSHFAKHFDLPPDATANLYRAYHQCKTRLEEANGPQKKQVEIDWFP